MKRAKSGIDLSLDSIERMILYPNRRKATLQHDPEGSNLIIAEEIKRSYALTSVFTEKPAAAYREGRLHLHQLGYPDRPSSSFNSLEYIKRFGILVPGSESWAAPARHPDVLAAHMIRFSASLQSHFSGPSGWYAFNVLFAPFVKGLDPGEIGQIAQKMIFELSQTASSRGGRSIHSGLHLYPEVPEFLKETPAVGPCGEEMEHTYGDFEKEARMLFRAIIEVYRRGDGRGYPFLVPALYIHVEKENFAVGDDELLFRACELASVFGSPCFLMERDGSLQIPNWGTVYPMKMIENERASLRRASFPSVSLNLPRAVLAGGDYTKTFRELLELAVKAHMEKRIFLEKLMAEGKGGPLNFLAVNNDGAIYLDFHSAAHPVGLVGLDEAVNIIAGEGLNSEKGFQQGLDILKFLNEKLEKLSRKYHLNLGLCQQPAESTAHRFARMDLHRFSPCSAEYVRGEPADGEVYYTAAGFVPSSAPIDPLKRAAMEGLLQDRVSIRSPVNIYIDSISPAASEILDFLEKVLTETSCRMITFSPSFTRCSGCGRLSRGDREKCGNCNSFLVDKLVRITDYYAYLSDCNKGKRGEIKERHINDGYF